MDPFLKAAIEEARIGASEGGIPIGSVLVRQGVILGRGRNRRMQMGNPILHGEMDALQNAGRLPAHIYQECTLYTTLSPCAMCSGAILLYGIPRIVIGENVTFMGEEHWLKSRGIRVELASNDECLDLMSEFISAHPAIWNEDIGES
jgi:creatinine deaminase